MYRTLLIGVVLLCLGAPGLAQVQKFPPGVSMTECRSRSFWVWVNQTFFGSNPWQLEAIDNFGLADVMSPSRAAQCGYTITTDVYGNVEVRISFLGCWVKNTNDNKFDIKFQFRLSRGSQFTLYPLTMSCLTYSWEVREMVCEENYMEVSVTRIMPSIILKILSAAGPVEGVSQRWQVWFNNSNQPIPAKDAISRGYGVNATVTRVVFRAPYKTPESQVVKVDDYNVDVLASNTMYTQTLLRIIVDTTLACPNDPPVFSANALSWRSPTIITPLVLGEVTNDTFDMGVNGKLLNWTQEKDPNYIFETDLKTVDITIPYGVPGGHIESDIVNNTYATVYKIHLMLYRTWEGINGDDFTTHTSYKPIVAPVIVQIPVFLDHTVKENGYFNVSLGNFYSDMNIKSFIIHNVPLKLSALGPRQMTVVAAANPNNTNVFYLTVPFSDPLVEQTYLGGHTRRYRLYVTYIMTHVSKNKNLTYPGVVECIKEDVVPPNITSSCMDDRMVLAILRGNMDYYWLPYIRELPLNDALIRSQNITVRSSEAYLYIEVPYTAVGLITEMVTLDGSLLSLNFTFRNNRTQEVKVSHSLSCPFPSKNLTCLPNGTMIAIVDSTLSKPAFNAQTAHLRDPKCTPQESTTEQALFSFTAFTCGTTRRLENDYLVYENEVTFDRQVLLSPEEPIISRDSSYRLTLRCKYPLRETLWVSAQKKNEAAQPGLGSSQSRVLRRRARTHVADLKLAKDENYAAFYHNGDFPVSVQPADALYFQAGVQSPEPVAALKDCWATTFPGKDGITRWDLVLDGCGRETETFSTEVQTSKNWLPRFKVTLHDAPTSQLFIHCVVLMCDAIPSESCPQSCNETRRLLDKRSAPLPSEMVSAGPVEIVARLNGVAYRHVAAETSWSTWTLVLSLGLAVLSAFTVGAIFLVIRLFIR